MYTIILYYTYVILYSTILYYDSCRITSRYVSARLLSFVEAALLENHTPRVCSRSQQSMHADHTCLYTSARLLSFVAHACISMMHAPVHLCVCNTYIYIYIYIYRERERDRDRDR